MVKAVPPSHGGKGDGGLGWSRAPMPPCACKSMTRTRRPPLGAAQGNAAILRGATEACGTGPGCSIFRDSVLLRMCAYNKQDNKQTNQTDREMRNRPECL